MLALRPLEGGDIPLVETWLNREHVKRWFEIPRLDTTIDDWMNEIREFRGEYSWITYLVLTLDNRPIGLCQFYKCADSPGEDYGSMPVAGSYGIDYLIGEEDCIGKGYGKEMTALLVESIFSQPDARRVTAEIDSDNKASEGTLLSCGFIPVEGTSNSCYSRYFIARAGAAED